MSPDCFIEHSNSSYAEFQREYHAKGFVGESHEAVCCRMAQTWRILCGAEPSPLFLLPVTHMRYVPYR